MSKQPKSELFQPGLVPPDYGVLVPVGVRSCVGSAIVKLDDGAQLEVKTLVFEVMRSLNRHNPDGNPVYTVQSAQIIKSKVPARLRVAAPASPVGSRPSKSKAKAAGVIAKRKKR